MERWRPFAWLIGLGVLAALVMIFIRVAFDLGDIELQIVRLAIAFSVALIGFVLFRR